METGKIIYRLQSTVREADWKGDKKIATTARQALRLIAKLQAERDAARWGVTRYWSDAERSARFIADSLVTPRRVLRNERTGVFATCPIKATLPDGWELIGTYSPGASAEEIKGDMYA